jgi:hypothetical protein
MSSPNESEAHEEDATESPTEDQDHQEAILKALASDGIMGSDDYGYGEALESLWEMEPQEREKLLTEENTKGLLTWGNDPVNDYQQFARLRLIPASLVGLAATAIMIHRDQVVYEVS